MERHEKIFSRTADTIRRVFPDTEITDTSVLRLIKPPAFSRFIGKHNIFEEFLSIKVAIGDSSYHDFKRFLLSGDGLTVAWVNPEKWKESGRGV